MLFRRLKSKKIKFLAKLFILCFVFISIFFACQFVYAQTYVPSAGITGQQASLYEGLGADSFKKLTGQIAVSEEELQQIEGNLQKIAGSEFSFLQGVEQKKTLASKLFQSTLSTALNTLAFDAANWIASGGKGQSAAFEQRDFGQIALDAVDAAAGDFLYNLGQEGIGGISGLNLCQPSAGVDIRIGLGLQNFMRPKPKCTFSEMRENWEQELRNPNFLKNFQDYFNPTSNDLGIALSVHTANLELLAFEKEYQVEQAKSEEIAAGGLKPISSLISGLKTTPAKFIYDSTKNQLIEQLGNNIGKYTGDALIDALNIFINQLAIQLIQRLLQGGLFQNDSGGGSAGIYNPYADTSGASGVKAAQERFREIIQPRFNVRGDYDILAELATCPDPNNAGPTNCVISDTFRQAIQERKTVGQAMQEGFLNEEGIFGFQEKDLEPRYIDEQYPYRSIIILRKFRILPVGWEMAASYINENFDTIGQQTIKDLVNCFDANDDYGAQGGGADWCRGLVDPNWVLKAPLNYCAREGYGPELISEPEIIQNEYNIQRQDDYCADEQSCIKENYDGSCEVYGYCTEERRTWNFGTDSCNPLYNTCQTFYGDGRESVSYLKNTLEWCDASGAGCRGYSNLYDYGAKEWSESSQEYFNRNVGQCDSDAEGCTEFIRAKAGLGTNLIPNSSFEEWSNSAPVGWNMQTGSMEQLPAEVNGAGSYAVKVSVSSGATASISKKILADNGNISLFAGHKYILSGLLKPNLSANGEAYLNISGAGFTASTLSLTAGDNEVWQRVYTIFTPSSNIANAEVKAVIDNANASDSAIIDALQLEEAINSDTPSAYRDYREANVIYEKILPNYLANGNYYDADGNKITGANDGIQGFCYKKVGNSYQMRDTAPAECFNYARLCTAEEADCELYTRVWDGFEIPAKVTPDDYCPQECNGYDLYVQKETTFESTQAKYLIPSTARACSAQADGCDQFTNLDEVEQGGEGIEYYSALRHCTTNSSDSAPFYVWEGSEDSGYQLRVFTLEQDGGELKVVSGEIKNNNHQNSTGAEVCNKTIFDVGADNIQHNSDCRQFYSKTGIITYALFSQTISYDTNCHPYRRSEVNIDPNLNSKTECDADGSKYFNVADSQFHWDADNQACYFCKNNGQWDDGAQACIYMAIPQQGTVCSAAQAGCRQYVGNVGNNVRNIITDDFEDGTSGGWISDGSTTINSNETESIKTNGHSIKITNKDHDPVINKDVGGLIIEGKSYIVEILAKGSGAMSIYLTNGIDSVDFDNNLNLNSEWQKGMFSLRGFNLRATGNEKLIIANNNDEYYIDYIILRELVDNYYLIKDSWNTPSSCDQDWNGDTAVHYMAGCYQYQDRDSNDHYLKSFSGICSESAVGCELMIDTKNSTSALGASYLTAAGEVSNLTVSDLNGITDGVKVMPDSLIYAVYDSDALCGGSDKGCERFGDPSTSQGQITSFSDIYLKNNPDRYGEILCGEGDIGCQEYRDNNNAYYYFKDPGDKTCEYRDGYYGFSWYQQKIKRCDDGSGAAEIDGVINHNSSGNLLEINLCLSAGDCGVIDEDLICEEDIDCGDNGICADDGQCHYACVLDNWDVECETDAGIAPKTVGYGGNNRIEQPSGGWAGLCPVYESGCTEIIDPTSEPSVNLIFNSDFSQDVDDNGTPDGWERDKQSVKLEKNTLYSIKINDVVIGTSQCSDYRLSADNKLINGNPVTSEEQSTLFYAGSNENCVIDVDIKGSNPSIELKKAIVNYQKEGGLDFSSCNGEYSYQDGCILFNNRSVNGSGYNKLIYDVDKNTTISSETQSLANCKAGSIDCDSNQVIKVQPDRICNEWLACRTKVTVDDEQVCYDIGICNGLNENNQCSSWVLSEPEEQSITINSTNIYANASGYSKVGFENIVDLDMRGDYHLGEMSQNGGLAIVPNGSFEMYGENMYPTGWYNTKEKVAWDSNMFSVVDNPAFAKEEGIFDVTQEYPIDGRAFLRYAPSTSNIESGLIDVEPGTDYILSFKASTIDFLNEDSIVLVSVLSQSNIPLLQSHALLSPPSSIDITPVKDWHDKVMKFNSGSNNLIKIRIEGKHNNSNCIGDQDNCPGNVYLDNIQIRPALQTRDNWDTTQSCRLYPESDSLSCDYIEDSGINQRGWYGYCLEYDRYPGNEDACLLWWPVDRVNGDIIDVSGGYNGRYPLYYCLETNLQIEGAWTQQVRKANSNSSKLYINGEEKSGTYVSTYVQKVDSITLHSNEITIAAYTGDGSGRGTTKWFFDLLTNYIDKDTNQRAYIASTESGDGWYYYPGASTPPDDSNGKHWYEEDYNILSVSGWQGVMEGEEKNANFGDWYAAEGGLNSSNDGFCINNCSDTGYGYFRGTFEFEGQFICDTVAQVVTPTGQNKAWYTRVANGSGYTVPILDYKYNSGITLNNYPPFGSSLPPSPLYEPYLWDSRTFDEIQPLYIEYPDLNLSNPYQVRAGLPYSCSPADQCKDFELTAAAGRVEDLDAAKELTGRLFANSYGIWEWSSETTSSGTCTGASGNCMYTGETCESSNSCGLVPEGTCVAAKKCTGGINDGNDCDDASDCNFEQNDILSHCTGGTVYQGECADNTMNPGSTCTKRNALDILSSCWSYPYTYIDWGLINGACKDADSFCKFNGIIDNNFSCDPESAQCIINSDDNICVFNSVGSCSNNGEECYSDYDCGEISGAGHYTRVNDNELWDVPGTPCNGNGTGVRPAYVSSDNNADYCYIYPTITNVKVSGNENGFTISKNGFVNLTFNSDVDDEQLPLTAMEIDWGDGAGEKTVVTGVEMRDQPASSTPHSFYHLYDYWDLLRKKAQGVAGITCENNQCTVKPKIKIKDNWGKYSQDSDNNDNPRVIVTKD
ncbi:MAG: hypothetical protein WC323_02515 [Patescibacteria group bacterium]|jgi:hypothetical protein